jgi:Mitochondrial K+-H+ exchange-related
MTVYLLSLGRDRFELYSEPPEKPSEPPRQGAGRLRHWAHAANVRWHALVESARQRTSTGRLAEWRDAAVRRLAETIAEQRTLWALAQHREAMLLFPASVEEPQARAALNRALEAARRHHGWWVVVDAPLFVASGLAVLIPGPNVLAYYLGFRLIGHWLSWRGARHALTSVQWTLIPDGNLAELAALVNLPRAARASRVDAIAARLNLHRLSAFFERVAA